MSPVFLLDMVKNMDFGDIIIKSQLLDIFYMFEKWYNRGKIAPEHYNIPDGAIGFWLPYCLDYFEAFGDDRKSEYLNNIKDKWKSLVHDETGLAPFEFAKDNAIFLGVYYDGKH